MRLAPEPSPSPLCAVAICCPPPSLASPSHLAPLLPPCPSLPCRRSRCCRVSHQRPRARSRVVAAARQRLCADAPCQRRRLRPPPPIHRPRDHPSRAAPIMSAALVHRRFPQLASAATSPARRSQRSPSRRHRHRHRRVAPLPLLLPLPYNTPPLHYFPPFFSPLLFHPSPRP